MNSSKSMLNKSQIGIIFAAFIVATIYANFAQAQQAKISEKKQVIKTYPFSDPDPVASIGNDRVIYPYYFFNGYSFKGKPNKWTVVTLENPYIKLWVLPQIGGKVWGAKEKSTGQDFIYHNSVLKFRDIAQRGPWTSGGIEFNFMPIVGHTPHAATPVDYLIKKNDDGSVSCWVGGMNWTTRAHWAVEIRLPKDASEFQTKGFFYNASPSNQPYYYWSNAAISIGDSLNNGLQYDYPATYYIMNGAQPWPITKDGLDISYFKNMGKEDPDYFLVGEYANYYGAYWHNHNFGFGHWARYNEMPGKKVFILGKSGRSTLWKKLLTDNNGQYTEVQTGRLYSQGHLKTISPQSNARWTGDWFPIKEIGGIKGASPYAVVNFSQDVNKLKIGINALKQIKDTLKVFKAGKLIHSELVNLQPMGVFKTNVGGTSNNVNYEIKLGDELTVSTKPKKKNLLNRSAVVHQNRIHDLSTAEGLFRRGVQDLESLKYKNAIQSFLKSLKINSHNPKVLTKTAEAYTHMVMYQKAFEYAKKALGINTYNAEANFIFGVINRRMEHLNQAKVAFGWAARSLKYRSAGYEQMAEVNIQQHNWKDAIYYGKKALDYNKYNMNAYEVLSIAYRKKNKIKRASKQIDEVINIDPLNHFVYFERYLLEPTSKNLKTFNSLIKHELPYETYLEIAMTYHHMGLDVDAVKVLKESSSNPIVNYWLAYLSRKNKNISSNYLHKALSASPKLVFPFRYETIPVLKWALKDKDNWKTKYYLGLILWSKSRNSEALTLMDEAKNNPDFAPFYLTRSKLRGKRNPNRSLRDLKRALKLNKNQWRTYRALAKWYMSNDKIEDAKKISKKGYKKFPQNYTLGVQYADILLRNGDYKKSFQLLNNLNVLPNEGGRHAQSIFTKALIKLAMLNMQHGRSKKAIKHLKIARTFPMHLGRGRPAYPDERIQDFLTARIYDLQYKSQMADSLYQKVYDYGKKINYRGEREFNFKNLIMLLTYEHLGKNQLAGKLQNKLMRSIDNQNVLVIAWLKALKDKDTSKMEVLRHKLLSRNNSSVPWWFKGILRLQRSS